MKRPLTPIAKDTGLCQGNCILKRRGCINGCDVINNYRKMSGMAARVPRLPIVQGFLATAPSLLKIVRIPRFSNLYTLAALGLTDVVGDVAAGLLEIFIMPEAQ